MSATMTLTMSEPHGTLSTSHSNSCPNCGFADPSSPTSHEVVSDLAAAKLRIADLEAQVLQLNQKAAAAIDRWADYEDEISRLRAAQSPTYTQPSTPLTPKDHQYPSPSRGSFNNRISALLTPRKSTPNLRSPPPPPPVPEVEDLLEALNKEQSLRKAAEGRLSKTSQEVEELSAALFEQANEMVADERRARAKLEERVGVLERRETERKTRLDRLEGAMERIQSARALLASEPEQERAVDVGAGRERTREEAESEVDALPPLTSASEPSEKVS